MSSARQYNYLIFYYLKPRIVCVTLRSMYFDIRKAVSYYTIIHQGLLRNYTIIKYEYILFISAGSRRNYKQYSINNFIT